MMLENWINHLLLRMRRRNDEMRKIQGTRIAEPDFVPPPLQCNFTELNCRDDSDDSMTIQNDDSSENWSEVAHS